MEELLNLINSLNNKKDIHGILLQSPIPKHLDINEAFKAISPAKDVDGFNHVSHFYFSLFLIIKVIFQLLYITGVSVSITGKYTADILIKH